MIHQCLRWIPHIWSQLIGPFMVLWKGNVRPLPDDLITDILSRVPADCVVKCRRVCRHWRALISSPSPYFVELHLERATTTSLFVQYLEFGPRRVYSSYVFIFDGEVKRSKSFKKNPSPSWETKMRTSILHNSCNGLLLFQGFSLFTGPTIYICNPVICQEMTLASPPRDGCVCGIYYRLSTREYNFLYVFIEGNIEGNWFDYSVCTLGENNWRPLAASFPYYPLNPPSAVDGCLIWMAQRSRTEIPPCTHAIMVFSTESEDFQAMPHPGNECQGDRGEHETMYLVEMKGQLGFCRWNGGEIDVWVLEDYMKWDWAIRYKVKLDWDETRYPFEDGRANKQIKILGIQNGEVMLLAWSERGLFSYHLEQQTVRKFVDKMFGCSYFYACSYTKSIVNPNSLGHH